MIKEEKFNELIETLKGDFSGDSSYMSGVNDGMYHLKRKLQELNIIKVNKRYQKREDKEFVCTCDEPKFSQYIDFCLNCGMPPKED